MARRHAHTDEAEINITPMLDIVFIMLIFFIVTTSFTKETGASIIKPLAEQAVAQGADYIAFGSFFPSRTKPQAVAATPDLLQRSRRVLNHPTCAIGATPGSGPRSSRP